MSKEDEHVEESEEIESHEHEELYEGEDKEGVDDNLNVLVFFILNDTFHELVYLVLLLKLLLFF